MKIYNLQDFLNILKNNNGLIIIKFGAKWCQPCKLIDSQVNYWFQIMPKNVQCISLDIDESLEIYSFLKTKKMLIGVPTILMYKYNNLSHIFDDSVNGTNYHEIELFFKRCITNAKF
jgi:thiol-disulfide isomerase/thioredoxin